MKKRGLTLGKYAPLHKGHQLVIETALAEMDELLLIIYDSPETTTVPLTVRSNWIRNLYPQIQVIEAWDGPTAVGASPQIKKMHEDYILNQLQIQDVTHFYSSEFYGEHMSIALNAVNRLVDHDRQTIPISGSTIRGNPFVYRDYLHPTVYRDLITNIVFLGAPSTGKTTIATQLATIYNTVWMPEYGRTYWETHHHERRLSLDQLVEIAEEHLVREEALFQQANRYLFTDTNALTTAMFSLAYHGKIAPRLLALAQKAMSRYDLVFLCDTDIPYDDTWDRSGEAQRYTFQKQIVSDLVVRKLPFIVLQGDLQTRIQQVQQILSRHYKYQNLVDLFNQERH